MKRLVLASRNEGKLRELRRLIGDSVFEVCCLNDYSSVPEVEETGSSFRENALIKARAAAYHSGEAALADDSGLEVDELKGAPGVYSSRFAGTEADDNANNAKVLTLLEGVPAARRNARFRCVVAVVFPDGFEYTTEGKCEGRIGFEPRGESGFGYDPIFIAEGYGCTMAELNPDEKNKISHRAQALEKAVFRLKNQMD